MFERFTGEARRLVVLAQEHARTSDDHHIGTEHFLLACLDDPSLAQLVDPGAVRDAVAGLVVDDLDRSALARIGIDLDRIRERVEETFGRGALDRGRGGPGRRRRGRRHGSGGHIPFTPEAKASLERALQEVTDVGRREIGVTAVFLALLHPAAGVSHRAVAAGGTDPAALRDRLHTELRRAA